MLDVAQPLMAAAPRLVSALLSGFAAPAPHPTIRGFAAYFNAYTWSAADALVGLFTAGYGWCHWAKLRAGPSSPSHNFH
jgi:hypothetical protein